MPLGEIPRLEPASSYVPEFVLLKLTIALSPFARKANEAAAEKWYNVGRSLPAHRAYARASYQLTPCTGKSPLPGKACPTRQNAGPDRPVASRNNARDSSKLRTLPSRVTGAVQNSGFW